jgi:N-acetylglucosamine-6-phosphate deacetylase
MMQAKSWGITHATHFCNAMSPFHHRAPGAIGAVMMDRDFSCEVIADGFHVHPSIVSFLKGAKGIEKIVLVTDALLPTGQLQGPFYANGEEVVLEGGVWRRKVDNIIAGSALTMLQGVKNLMSWGYSLEDAVTCASTNPARLIGREDLGVLKKGAAADLLLVDKNLSLQKVIHG